MSMLVSADYFLAKAETDERLKSDILKSLSREDRRRIDAARAGVGGAPQTAPEGVIFRDDGTIKITLR